MLHTANVFELLKRHIGEWLQVRRPDFGQGHFTVRVEAPAIDRGGIAENAQVAMLMAADLMKAGAPMVMLRIDGRLAAVLFWGQDKAGLGRMWVLRTLPV